MPIQLQLNVSTIRYITCAFKTRAEPLIIIKMFAAKLVSLLSASAAAVEFSHAEGYAASAGDDASLHCLSGTAFCERTREFKID